MRLALKHKIVLVLVFSLVLTIITGIRGSTNDTGVKTVKRPPAGEVKEVELSVTREGDTETLPVHLKVDPRSYSKEEAGKILESVVQNLPELIKGNNKDLHHVTGDLKLDTSLTDINVTAQWSSSDFETVSFDGQVFNTQMKEGEAKDVELPVQLSLGEALAETVVKIRVLPHEYSPEEKSAIDINNALGEADREAALKDEITLPTEVNGRGISFSSADKGVSPWIFIPVGIALSVCMWYMEKKKKEKEERERNEELASDYAGIASRMSLLCGAGMTVYSAWDKITGDYEKGKNKDRRTKREAYERMSETFSQINNGMSEPEGYTRFGEACGIREYKKLGSYLSEYVRKGTGDLKKLLHAEAQESFTRRKAMIKVKAEEAGTRLLFPMIMMLGVVMAVVMLPAMRSFSF